MKRNYIYHFVALLLGGILLGACNQQSSREEALNKSDNNTSMRFAVRVTAEGTPRAIDEVDEQGTDGERSVGSMTVLFNNIPPRTFSGLTPVTSVVSTPVFEINEKDAAKVSSFSTLINASRLSLTQLDLNSNKVVSLSDFDKLVNTSEGEGKYKEFLMSATAEDGDKNKISILPGVKEDEVGTAPGKKNLFELSVERVLSKAQLYKSSSLDVTEVPGTITKLHWAVAGSGKQVYLYRNHAGDRTMGTDGIYNKLTTASDQSDLMKLSNVIKKTTDEGNFAWKELSATASGKQSIAGGIYFYEHALEETKGQSKPYPRTVGYDKVTYAKVYADLGTISKGKRGEFNEKAFLYFSAMSRVVGTKKKALNLTTCEIPNEPDLFKGTLETWETMREHLKDASSGDFEVDRWYWVCVSEIPKWDLEKKKKLFGKERFSTPDRVSGSHQGHTFFLMHDTPGTFYVGANGIIYDTLLAAMADGNKSARKYAGGRMVYLTPLNAQGEPNKIYNCDTRRNNIYDLEIQGVNGLGYNYDPVDPNDPYIPKPEDNPLEPDPVIPPINNPEITLKVKARVLNWNYIHQSYDLLGETK